MKYIEELTPGSTFAYEGNSYILTSDFKKSGSRLCYGLKNGNPKWFQANYTVDVEPIYILDKDNNVIPLKETIDNNAIES